LKEEEMMKIVQGLSYTEDHEWVKIEKNIAYIGITDYAQKSLGAIVFAELPAPDTLLTQGDGLGVIESVKAASDIYAPLSGIVVSYNQEVIDTPELLNQDPYENWLISMKFTDSSQLDELMDADTYTQFINKE
jgi:glycine cleavage system H protein